MKVKADYLGLDEREAPVILFLGLSLKHGQPGPGGPELRLSKRLLPLSRWLSYEVQLLMAPTTQRRQTECKDEVFLAAFMVTTAAPS